MADATITVAEKADKLYAALLAYAKAHPQPKDDRWQFSLAISMRLSTGSARQHDQALSQLVRDGRVLMFQYQLRKWYELVEPKEQVDG